MELIIGGLDGDGVASVIVGLNINLDNIPL